MSHSHTVVVNAKPKDKLYKLFDGGGLYLQVNTSGNSIFETEARGLEELRLLIVSEHRKLSVSSTQVSI